MQTVAVAYDCGVEIVQWHRNYAAINNLFHLLGLIDQSTAFKKESVEVGPAYTGSKLANEVALNVGKGGAGVGRTVHHCGSQGTHGNVNPGHPTPAGKDILSEFGPEKRKG